MIGLRYFFSPACIPTSPSLDLILVCFGFHGYMSDFSIVQSRSAWKSFRPIRWSSRRRLDAWEAGLTGASITSCAAAPSGLRYPHSGPGTSLKHLLRIYIALFICLSIKCEFSGSEWRHLVTRVRSRNWITRLRAGWVTLTVIGWIYEECLPLTLLMWYSYSNTPRVMNMVFCLCWIWPESEIQNNRACNRGP